MYFHVQEMQQHVFNKRQEVPLICPSHPHILATSVAQSRNYFKTSMCPFYIYFGTSPVKLLTP